MNHLSQDSSRFPGAHVDQIVVVRAGVNAKLACHFSQLFICCVLRGLRFEPKSPVSMIKLQVLFLSLPPSPSLLRLSDFLFVFPFEMEKGVVRGGFRPEMKFGGLPALIARIQTDIGLAKVQLDAEPLVSLANDPFLA